MYIGEMRYNFPWNGIFYDKNMNFRRRVVNGKVEYF
jgi:hypothetical protein